MEWEINPCTQGAGESSSSEGCDLYHGTTSSVVTVHKEPSQDPDGVKPWYSSVMSSL